MCGPLLLGQAKERPSGESAARVEYPEARPIGFFGSYRVGADKIDPSKLPIIGAWRINLDRSDPSTRVQGRFKPTGTTIYTAVNGGINTETFLYYPPKDDRYKTVFTDDGREYWFKLDGRNIYKNPQGPNGLGQTVGMWLVDRNTIMRERMTKGVIDERVLYRVSPDGKTLAWTIFRSTGDSSQIVWDRIDLQRP
ncbi:MAG TPA: hypothetical protein VG897_08520 [Terriglobales bacterium]|nr:hypothetical protein [Terriglobales bacterium]